MATPDLLQACKEAINKIAKDDLYIESLEVRNSDRLDFKEQHVGSIEYALSQAFMAGVRYQAQTNAVGKK